MQSLRGVVEARLVASCWWVWGFVVVNVECKRVVKEGYPALWRALAALLVFELEPEPREGSKAPSYRRGANLQLIRMIL